MYKYLIEIKNRSCLIILMFFSLIIIFYMYKEFLLFFIVKTTQFLKNSNRYTYYYFIFTDVTEIFYVYFKLICFFSIQFILYYSIYQSLFFVSPSLYKNEHFNIKYYVKISFIIYFFSIIFSYNYLIPLSWNFFLSYQTETLFNYNTNLYFEIKLNEYLIFYINMYYYCIIYFQVFVLFSFFLIKKEINLYSIKRYKKLYVFCFIILSTLLSPPDIVSQISVSFFIIILYELIIFSFNIKKLIKNFN